MRKGLLVALVLVVLVVVVWLARRDDRKTANNETKPNATSASPTLNVAPTVIASGGGAVSAPIVVAKAAPSINVPWGTGSGALGKKAPQEGNPEAPMSLAVGPDGVTWVLDQVNDRIVRYGRDGKVIDIIPLTVKGAQDIVIAKDGTALVLDRLVDKRVAIIGPDGKPQGSLTLEGKGIPEGGGATGVFTQGNSVWVEREHERSVRIGDTKGTADADRKEAAGRPTRDGSGFIRGWLEPIPGQRAFVTFTNKDSEAQRFTRQITTALVSLGVVVLDTDAAGIIYFGVLGGKVNADGQPEGAPIITLYCLEPLHGAPIGQTSFAANQSVEETFRELVVLDEGGALFMKRTESGVSIVPVDCRGGT